MSWFSGRHAVLIVALAVGLVGCWRSVEIPQPSPATIRIRSLTPPAGSEITSATTIVVELEYMVERFEPNRFRLGATAATVESGISWSLAPVKGKESQTLLEAAGTRTVRFEAKALWEKTDLKRPFEISFSVDQLVGTWGVTVAAATTDPIVFKAAAAGR